MDDETRIWERKCLALLSMPFPFGHFFGARPVFVLPACALPGTERCLVALLKSERGRESVRRILVGGGGEWSYVCV